MLCFIPTIIFQDSSGLFILYSNENNSARLTDVDAAVTRNDKLFQIYNENSNVYLIKPEKNMEIKKIVSILYIKVQEFLKENI